MRRESFTFVDTSPEDESRKAFCERCEDISGKLNKLVPRIVEGITDDKFRICCYCGEVYPIHDMKLITEYEPKAVSVNNPYESSIKVGIIQKKRKARDRKHTRSIDNDMEIPDLAGREDKDLKAMLKDRVRIINYIDDTVLEG
jgi:hypothetical protein